MNARKEVFGSAEFKEKLAASGLEEEYKKQAGHGVDKCGYPDSGSGIFSQLLTPGQWEKLNRALRAHNNYIEALPVLLLNTLVGGLYFPLASASVAGIVIIGRHLYGKDYRARGGAQRYSHGPVAVVGTLGGLLLAIGSALKFTSIGASLPW